MASKVVFSKDVFLIEDLDIRALRMYLVICSQLYTKKMTKEQKEYIVGSSTNRRFYAEFDNYLAVLEMNNLIKRNEEGVWTSNVVKECGRFIVFDELPKIKSMRQLFVICMDRWHIVKKRVSNPIISSIMFKSVFGEFTKKYWNRTCKSLGVDYSYDIQTNGTVLIQLRVDKIEECENPTTEKFCWSGEYTDILTPKEEYTTHSLDDDCSVNVFGLVNGSVLF